MKKSADSNWIQANAKASAALARLRADPRPLRWIFAALGALVELLWGGNRCLRGVVLYPNLSRINFLGPSFFRNKFPFPKKGTTPRRTWYTKNIQNQFWDHGGKHLWVKFQWPRSCLSLCKSPRNSTLFFGCNPSVDEYFSMGQPPWTLKIPKLGLNQFPRRIIFSATGSGKKILPARTRFNTISRIWALGA